MKRREIMRRVLAAGLCLCVCAGLAELALPALASAGAVSSTNFYVEHIYLGNVGLSQSGYINNISYELHMAAADVILKRAAQKWSQAKAMGVLILRAGI